MEMYRIYKVYEFEFNPEDFSPSKTLPKRIQFSSYPG
jgi:hypothetical protein